jgi:hypothetical protein
VTASRALTFRRIRIALLLAVLAVVVLAALADYWRRHERTQWQRPLAIALVVLRRGPVEESSLAALKERVHELETVLEREQARHLVSNPIKPFEFQVFGPLDVSASAPAPDGDGVWDLAVHAWRTWRFYGSIDERVELESRAFDSRIYLFVRPADSERQQSVEGLSEQGGRIGSVEVELDDGMVDFALFVATHELFHTLGATDKYDGSGRALLPQGLADPDQVPLYPQARAEIMARNLVVAPGVERPPESLAEIRVGQATAREIGWRD